MVWTLVSICVLMLAWVACDAMQDTVAYHYDTSVFRNAKHRRWLDPSISWKNKWKDGDAGKGERFFGSSTFLVWLTDFWHFMKAVKIALLWSALGVALSCWVIALVGTVAHGIVFECVFRVLGNTRINNNSNS